MVCLVIYSVSYYALCKPVWCVRIRSDGNDKSIELGVRRLRFVPREVCSFLAVFYSPITSADQRLFPAKWNVQIRGREIDTKGILNASVEAAEYYWTDSNVLLK